MKLTVARLLCALAILGVAAPAAEAQDRTTIRIGEITTKRGVKFQGGASISTARWYLIQDHSFNAQLRQGLMDVLASPIRRALPWRSAPCCWPAIRAWTTAAGSPG